MNTFIFTDADFLEMINLICKLETSIELEEYTPITSMEESLDIEKLDSLAIIMLVNWINELFCIPDSAVDSFFSKKIFTVQSIKDFVIANSTGEYSEESFIKLKECIHN